MNDNDMPVNRDDDGKRERGGKLGMYGRDFIRKLLIRIPCLIVMTVPVRQSKRLKEKHSKRRRQKK